MRDEKRGLFFEVLLLKKIEPKTAETVGAVGFNGNGTKMEQKNSIYVQKRRKPLGP